MEQFRKTLIKRNIYIAIVALAAAIVYFALFLTMGHGDVSAYVVNHHGAVYFHTGVFVMLEAFLIGMVVRNLYVLKSNKRLQALYIKENDERNAMIKQKTGAAFLPICAVGLGVAAIVAYYLNHTVFWTLLAVMYFMAAVKAILLWYYKRKF